MINLKRFLHVFLSNSYIYNFVQKVLSLGRKEALEQTESILHKYSKNLVLDVGCGPGRYQHVIKNGRIAGLDILLSYLYETKKHYDFALQGDSSCLPFKDSVFYTIFSVGLFHHISDDVAQKTVLEMIRCVKTDGKIVIIDPLSCKNRFDLISRMFMWLDRGEHFKSVKYFHDVFTRLKGVELVEEGHISKSYPYNLHYFILNKEGGSCD